MGNLPGSIIQLTSNNSHVCEYCDEKDNECMSHATYKVVVESDSFGSEYGYYCDTHIKDVEEQAISNPPEDNCDHCKRLLTVHPYRDYEEGYNGPVYWLCECCLRTAKRRDAEIYEEDYPD